MFAKVVNSIQWEYNWIFTVFIGLIVFYFVNYYKKVYSYPRGPFPLPVLGNVLKFGGSYNDYPIIYKLKEWTKKFGPIYTVWIGSTPIVMCNNYELNSEASLQKRNEFVERSDIIFHEIFRNGTQNIFSTNGPHWEALRKVGIFAIRKFQTNERLAEIVKEVMDEAVELMTKEDKPFNPQKYIDFMIYNILALTAFGTKFGSIDNQSFKDAKRLNDEFYEVAANGLISDYISWLRPFYYSKELKLKDMTKASIDVTKNHFAERKKTYTKGIIRDFADCVLEAKEEAIRENYSRSKYLTEDNLYMIVSDLFLAGTDTTQTAMRWSLLLLANDSKMQQKIYEEIQSNIGDRTPTQEDKSLLPFTTAYIMEVLRFRPSAPMGIDHSNPVDSELGGHKLPKNTVVMFNILAQNTDPKYWSKPEEFNPNRFLDQNGKLNTSRPNSFATFGLGPRTCPGERLAINNFFLMNVCLLQKLKLELTTGDYSADLTPQNMLLALFPKNYTIVCHKRD